jgi:hypothetical protein
LGASACVSGLICDCDDYDNCNDSSYKLVGMIRVF